jgi:hypothetical protein
VPLSPDEFYAHARAAADADGRLPVPDVALWETFPFDPAGLRTVPLQPPELPEPPRGGEGGRPCWACGRTGGVLWFDERWQLTRFDEGGGAPLTLILEPREHLDLPELGDELAAELGVLIVRLARAVEGLPHIARAHVMRIGDGGAHLHVFVMARPEGFGQLRGSNFLLWDDILPAPPPEVQLADVRAVVDQLAAEYGGTPA